MASNIVVGTRDPKSGEVHDFSGVVGRASLVAGLVYLIGTLFDLGILWIAQNDGSIQFEFVGLTRTAEAFPRLFVATALVYLGVYLVGTAKPAVYRLLAVWVIGLGLAALALLALLGLNYASISANVTEEGRTAFRTAIVKTGGLGILYVISLLPLGILGFSTRKR